MRYYKAAKSAVRFLWRKRSSLSLMGSMVDVASGKLTETHATVGPGQDSFLEYLLKGYLLFGDDELLDMFMVYYEAISSLASHGGFVFNTDIFGSGTTSMVLSSLSAFWGAVQVLYGDVAGAARTQAYWGALWMVFDYVLSNFYPTFGY